MDNINIDINTLSYNLSGYHWFPLPYGEFKVQNARFFGQAISTRGGGWRWELPKNCIVGYGKFSPYVEFEFTGAIRISSSQEEFYDYFLRSNDRRQRWLHFDGKFKPSKLSRLENLLNNMLNEMDFKISETTLKQGHLIINPLEINKPYRKLHNLSLNEVVYSIIGRRKILNHQFFGNCRIYRLRNYEFIIFVRDTTYVVSPDHLEEPLELEQDIYLASHPEPTLNGVD